jgi:hypothetical protein
MSAESGKKGETLLPRVVKSRLTGEAGLVIYPCKACVSTAQPLCHWPCSCYPNHALRQRSIPCGSRRTA